MTNIAEACLLSSLVFSVFNYLFIHSLLQQFNQFNQLVIRKVTEGTAVVNNCIQIFARADLSHLIQFMQKGYFSTRKNRDLNQDRFPSTLKRHTMRMQFIAERIL